MWFFKKRKDKLEEIEQKLNKSFLHIKSDMSFLFKRIEDQDNELKNIKNLMSTTEILASTQEKPTTKLIQFTEGEEEDYSLKNTYETLTNIHKVLLLKLGLLLKESPGEWIPMKVLTREMYPNKQYENVKSMISNYTDNLLNLGFIQKKRIGRQIVLTLTEKAQHCLPEIVKNRKGVKK